MSPDFRYLIIKHMISRVIDETLVLNSKQKDFWLNIRLILLNSLKYFLGNKNKVRFITLTNNGYIKFTLNCYKSLENIGYPNSLVSYCIGKECFEKLKQKGYQAEFIDDEKNTNFQVFRSGNWANITYYKFEIIFSNLKKYGYVCFTDGDIVYEDQNFMQFCLQNIKDNDLLIQSESKRHYPEEGEGVCCGFMFIKSNRNTLRLFNPENVKSRIEVGWDDQVYVNEIKSQLKYETLPLNLFPNGRYYYKNYRSLTPYIIHFNWIVGRPKIGKMLFHKKWYVGIGRTE